MCARPALARPQRWEGFVKTKHPVAPIAALLIGVTGPTAALGQRPATDVLEEIIVTAQKREESAQKTPVSVTALTPDDLDAKRIVTMEGLKQLVPGFYMEQATSGTTTPKMFLRGVGVDNQVFSFESPIGLYVDGVYIARVTGALTDLYDVERVEFLRGPQGTLYGRNSSVGALNIWRRLPSLDESRLSAGVSYGSWNQTNAQFHASAPFVQDRLAAGITATYRRNDGWMTDTRTGEKAADEDIISVRGSTVWQPSETVSVIFRADMMRDHSLPTQASNFLINPDNDLRTYESSPGSGRVNEVEPWGVSATIDWDIGALRVTSISAYRELYYNHAADHDGRAAVRSFELDRQELNQDQITQEIYASGDSVGSRQVKWTVGAFYLLENNDLDFALRVFTPPTTQTFDQRTDSEALYAQASFPLTDRLNLTTGVRQTWETKDFTGRQFAASNTVPTQNLLLNPAFSFRGKKSESRFNWRAALDFALNNTVMLYANAGTGFRSGGFNGNARDLASITSGAFDPETTFMAEAGVKSDLLDRRLRLNVLYYYSDYKNLQMSIVQPNGSILAGNVAADTNGVELEVTAVPLDGLRLTGSLGSINQDIHSSPRELKSSPKLQWRVGANYERPLGSGGGQIRIGTDVAHSDRYFNDASNSAGTETWAYSQWNAFAGYAAANDRWAVTLTGYNLGDAKYENHAFNIANGLVSSVKYPITPRRWLLSLEFNF